MAGKIAIIGDIHIKPYTEFGLGSNGKPKRLNQIRQALLEFVGHMVKEEVVTLVLTGDLFEHRDQIDTQSLDVFFEFLSEATNAVGGGNIIAIEGNHDNHSRYKESFWIRHIPRLSFVGPSSWNVAGIRYTEDKEELRNMIIEARKNFKAKLFVGHFGVIETASVMGITDANSVSVKLLENFKAPIILGHYHDPHVPMRNVIYIGTPWQNTFGEKDTQRGMLIYNTNTLKSQLVKTSPHMSRLITISEGEYETLDEETKSGNFFRIIGSTKKVVGENIVRQNMVKPTSVYIDMAKDDDDMSTFKNYLEITKKFDKTMTAGMVHKAKEIMND